VQQAAHGLLSLAGCYKRFLWLNIVYYHLAANGWIVTRDELYIKHKSKESMSSTQASLTYNLW